MFFSFLLGKCIYNQVDNGVANVLALETLRHGTNPYSNLLIRHNGGNPECGGAEFGSTHRLTQGSTNQLDSRNYFYLFKDPSEASWGGTCGIMEAPLNEQLGARILSRVHARLSGIEFTDKLLERKNSPQFIKNFSAAIGRLSIFISPTLRFRFSNIDPLRLENDPDYHGLAYRTKKVVEPWRLGLVGSLITGADDNWFSRAQKKPKKVLIGAVQIATAVIATTLYINIIRAYPCMAVAGALLA